MRTFNVSFPEMIFVAATRGLGGVGIGLLAAGLLKEEHRKKVGLALLGVGALTTIPIAYTAIRRSGGELPTRTEPARLPPAL